MSEHIIEEIEKDNKRAEIFYDEDADSPRRIDDVYSPEASSWG
jgi:hypothetical protein